MPRMTIGLLFIFSLVMITLVTVLSYKDMYKILPIDEAQQAADAGQYENWVDYIDPRGMFIVRMPVIPQRATETVRDSKTDKLRRYDMYVAEDQQQVSYMITVITFEEMGDAIDQDMKLTTLMNDMVAANSDNKVRKFSKGTYEEHPSLNFSFYNSRASVAVQAFITGHFMYILSVISRDDEPRNAQFAYFTNSFKINPTPL